MLPDRVVYVWPCHLPIELEHRAWWAIKILNLDLNAADEERRLSLNELEEIRREAYDNTRLSKERAKTFHNRQIHKKVFSPG